MGRITSREVWALLRTASGGEIARGAAGTLSIRIFGLGIATLMSLVLARILGAEGYGAVSFAMAWLGVLGAISMLGMDGLLVREAAVYQSRSEWSLLRGLLRRANQATLIFAICIGAVTALAGLVFARHLDPQMLNALWMSLVILPLLTLMRVRQAAMIGMRNVLLGQLPEAVILPLVFATLVAFLLGFSGLQPNALLVISSQLAAVAIVLPLSYRLLSRSMPLEARTAPRIYNSREWASGAWMFWLTASFNLLSTNGGVILLGMLKGAAATGVFAIASAAAGLIALPMAAIGTPLAPAIARAHASGMRDELQALSIRSARIGSLLAIPAVAIYIVLGKWLLAFFGADFVVAYNALLILSFAQLFNAAVGSVGVMLQMTGHERAVATCFGLSAALSIILGFGLIPSWGIEGAAVAMASGVIFWNASLAVLVHRWLGVRPTAFGWS